MDAITTLRNDHRDVEKLFKEVLRTEDETKLQRLGMEIIKELSIHAAIEEQIFYPAVLQALPREQRALVKSLEAHHAAKSMLAEVDRLTAASDRYKAKLEVLIDNVRHHIEEEEQDLFPKVRNALKPNELEEIGDLLETAKKVAPTKPHPHAPDTPPANLANLAVAVVDRARTAGEEALRRLTSSAPTKRAGSPAKKAPAKKPASPAKKTTAAATKTSKSAKKTASSAKKAGKSAAKKTTSSAKKAGKSTMTKTTKASKSAKKTAKKATKKR